MNDEKLDALLEAMAENTTTLIDVHKQAAATSASTKDARTYVQTIAKQTDWETNGKDIAAVLSMSLEEDHDALHAASDAAIEMRGLSVELTRKADRAAEAQMEGASKLHAAAQRLSEAQERLEAGEVAQIGRDGPHRGSYSLSWPVWRLLVGKRESSKGAPRRSR